MRIEYHYYHHADPSVEELKDRLIYLLGKVDHMTAGLQKVLDEVAELKTVNASAISLLKKLGGLIRDNIGNEAALETLAGELDTEGKAISDAVVENTPAEPA